MSIQFRSGNKQVSPVIDQDYDEGYRNDIAVGEKLSPKFKIGFVLLALSAAFRLTVQNARP